MLCNSEIREMAMSSNLTPRGYMLAAVALRLASVERTANDRKVVTSAVRLTSSRPKLVSK
jgi:hypothetical protein